LKNESLLQIHSAVLLFGLAGLFGKLLPQGPALIVLGRVAFAAAFLAFLLRRRGLPLLPEGGRELGWMSLQGLLLAFHWVVFFHAIQLSSVALGLCCFATFPVFAALLEPVLLRERFRPAALPPALAAFCGVILVARPPGGELGNLPAVLSGVLAGASFALLSVLNRKLVRRSERGTPGVLPAGSGVRQPGDRGLPGDTARAKPGTAFGASSSAALSLSFRQDLAASLFLLPALWLEPVPPGWRDLGLLILLGVFCTALAHSLFIAGLRRVQARRAALIVCLEPLYGILFAALLLGERPGAPLAAGGILILAAAAWASWNRSETA